MTKDFHSMTVSSFHRTRDPIGEQGGLNLYAIVGNAPVNRWDKLGLWGCNGTIIGGPTITEGAKWKLYSVTFDINKNTVINPGTVATSFLTDINLTWRLQGNVKCCCKVPGAGIFTYKRNRVTYKTKTDSLALDPFILGFSLKGPITIPTPVDLLGLIGELVSEAGGNIVTDVGATVIDPADQQRIRSIIETLLSKKPTSNDEGDWLPEPCK